MTNKIQGPWKLIIRKSLGHLILEQGVKSLILYLWLSKSLNKDNLECTPYRFDTNGLTYSTGYERICVTKVLFSYPGIFRSVLLTLILLLINSYLNRSNDEPYSEKTRTDQGFGDSHNVDNLNNFYVYHVSLHFPFLISNFQKYFCTRRIRRLTFVENFWMKSSIRIHHHLYTHLFTLTKSITITSIY